MALEGSFQDMSLSDLFQIFRSGLKSGVLVVAAEPERGVIYVYKGQLIDAVLIRGTDRNVLASAEDAVIALLLWDTGTFVFRHDPGSAERAQRITHDAEWLVLEALKRREHPQRMLPHQQLTLASRIELAAMPNGAESGVNLNLNQWRMLSQVAICETLGEICERVGYSAEQGIQIAAELLAVGLIEISIPVKPVVPPRPKVIPQGYTQPYPSPARVPMLVPAHAASGLTSTDSARGLLGAIMRRIRGL